MTIRTTVEVICDEPYEPGSEHPADRTVRLSLGAEAWEKDLCSLHGDAVAHGLAEFTGAARLVKADRRRPNRNATARRRSAAIRAWAMEQGLPVTDRGRISKAVVAKYEAEHEGRS